MRIGHAKIIPDKQRHRYVQELFNKQLIETPLQVSSMALETLWKLSVRNWKDYQASLPASAREAWEPTTEFGNKIQVNFLRHCASNYDNVRGILVSGMLSQRSCKELHRLLKSSVLKQIAQQYPALAEECKRQSVENKKKNG